MGDSVDNIANFPSEQSNHVALQLSSDKALHPYQMRCWGSNIPVIAPGTHLRVAWSDLSLFAAMIPPKTDSPDLCRDENGNPTKFDLSDALAAFCGETPLTFGDALYRVLTYIDNNPCYFSGNPSYVRCDAALKKILGFNVLMPCMVMEMILKNFRSDVTPRRRRSRNSNAIDNDSDMS